MSRWTAAAAPALLVAALGLGLVACGGGEGDPDPGASPTSVAPGPTTTTTAPDEPGALEVAVVADSEIPDELVDALDARPDLRVTMRELHGGAPMAALDGHVDAALATDPDVLLYAGGTNDLPSGPQAVLDGLAERLPRYGAGRCLVMAIPIFRYERGTPAEVAERTAGTRVLERHVRSLGAVVVSYLDVSLAMDAEGEDFFHEGELGRLHPGPQAYQRITAALAEGIGRCPQH